MERVMEKLNVGSLNELMQKLDPEFLQEKPSLSPSEVKVALGMVKGMSDEEIAQETGKPIFIVKNQIRSIFRKRNISSAAELKDRLVRR